LNSTSFMAQYSTEMHDLFFSKFARSDVEILLPLMEEISLIAGDVLFHLNESGDKLYLVTQGRLAVQKRTGFGERTQVVALLNPGAPVGQSLSSFEKKLGQAFPCTLRMRHLAILSVTEWKKRDSGDLLYFFLAIIL
jgi:CRP-like cAMP-binding protein